MNVKLMSMFNEDIKLKLSLYIMPKISTIWDVVTVDCKLICCWFSPKNF